MNIAILFCSGTEKLLSHEFYQNGGGGTETCAIQLAEELAKDHTVDFIGPCENHTEYGVNYVYDLNLESTLKENKYDFVLIICYYKNIINLIEKYDSSKNIVILHTLNGITQHIWNQPNSTWSNSNYEIDDELKNSRVKKFVALSKSQKDEFIRYNNVPANLIEVIPNGIDISLFEGISMDHEIDHTIFWSSNIDRGAQILIGLLPYLKEFISDIKIKISTPSYQKKVLSLPGIEFLGTLSKRNLVNEMTKHACWWYPSTFNETFCITSVEEALAGNDLILPLINGPATTFEKFKDNIAMSTSIHDGMKFVVESCERISKSINNYHDSSNVKVRQEIQSFLLDNYNWQKISKRFLDLLK